MKTRRFLAATLAFAAAAMLAPAARAQSKPTLNIFCWSEYIPQEVIDAFAKQEKAKVNIENYASNEEMLAKLAGGAKYDLIQPSEYVVEEMIAQGKLEEIDHAALPNLANLEPKFLKMAHDPENKFSIPWMAGSVGIVVNTAKVKDDIKTYADVFQPARKKRIVVLADNREMVSWALTSLGKNMNDFSDENLAAAKGVLAQWLPLVKVYDSDSPKTAFLNGSVDVGIVWGGEAAILWNKNKKFRYVLPEGAHLFIDSLCVPKGAKNKELALKFINYVLDGKVAKKVWEEFPYTSPNAEAKKLMSKEPLANPASFPAGDPKLEIFKAIPPATSAKIDKLVTDLKNK